MSDGIHCLVFSKDRAMQLDAFLRSAKQHAPYASINVLLTDMVGRHGESYRYIGDEFVVRREGYYTFSHQVRQFLSEYERVVFHTDDDVFFANAAEAAPGYYERAAHHLGREIEIGSLRLGRNTTFCHPTGLTQTVPVDFPVWLWRDAQGDFGYPLSLNGTVYRSADLLPLLDFPFSNPTELEAGLAARADRFGPQWMTAPLHSCCVSLPHNRVSVSSGCPAGSNPEWQPDALRERFLAGWRIDLDAMDFTDVIGAHQEIPLKFFRP